MKTPPIHYDYIRGRHPHMRMVVDSLIRQKVDVFSMATAGMMPSQERFTSAMVSYALEGQQVFLLGRHLQLMLGDTDVTKLPVEFVKFPFDSFYMSFGDSTISVWDGVDKHVPLAGVYVQHHNNVVYLSIWGHLGGDDDAHQWLSLDLSEVPTITKEDGTSYFDLEAYLDLIMSNRNARISDPGVKSPTELQEEENRVILTRIVRLVFNLVLYVNAEKADKEPVRGVPDGRKRMLRGKLKQALKNPKKRKKAARIQKELDAISEARVVWLGKSLEEANRSSRNVESSEGSSRTVRRHRRMGHWRTVWVGSKTAPDGSVRKGEKTVLRWIQPCWVGEDIAGRVHGTVYKFREDKQVTHGNVDHNGHL